MKNSLRFLLIILLFFEILNWLGILRYTLSFSWLGLIGTLLGVWFFAEYTNTYLKKNYPIPETTKDYSWLILFFSVIGLYGDAVSDIFKLYSKIMWWDRLMHFIGGALVAAIASYILSRLNFTKTKLFFSSYFIIATTSLFGFLYEYWEYLEDLYYFKKPFALGDVQDTIDDLSLNIVGALIVVIFLIAVRLKRGLKKNDD